MGYRYLRNDAPRRSCGGGDSLTKQEFKDECDINRIMKRYEKTGVPPPTSGYGGVYGDFSTIGDFQEAQNRLIAAREQFMALSARVRDRFSNDPGRLIAFLSDESNREEAVKLGIIAAPVVEPEPKPMKVEVVNPVVPPPSGGKVA